MSNDINITRDMLMPQMNAGADDQPPPNKHPVVVAVVKFLDGIPTSVPAQIAQLITMHLTIMLNTTNDYARNSIVSSLVTTMVGLLVSTVWNLCRCLVLYLVTTFFATPTTSPSIAARPRSAIPAIPSKTDPAIHCICDGPDVPDAEVYMHHLMLPASTADNGFVFQMDMHNHSTSDWSHVSSNIPTVEFCAKVVHVSRIFRTIMRPLKANIHVSAIASPPVIGGESSSPPQNSDATKLTMDVRPVSASSNALVQILCPTRAQFADAAALAKTHMTCRTGEEAVTHSALPPVSPAEIDEVVAAYQAAPVFVFGTQYLRSNSRESIRTVVRILYLSTSTATRKSNRSIFDLEGGRGYSQGYPLESIQYKAANEFALSPRFTLSKMHLESMPILRSALEKFQTGTLYPPGLLMTNKLGILMYGPPGTGKTNTIRAITNHLGRNLIRIDCSKLAQFDEAAFLAFIRKIQTTFVIELDEFDHVLAAMEAQTAAAEVRAARKRELVEIQMMRGGFLPTSDGDAPANANASDVPTNAPTDKPANVPDRLADEARQELSRLMKIESNQPITAGFVLRWLDGLGQDDNRVVVICTNNPNQIRPEFFRSGRVDVKLYCGHCTVGTMTSLLETKYPRVTDSLNPDNDWDKVRADEWIPDLVRRNITPLQLINTLAGADDLATCLTLLEGMPFAPDYPFKDMFETDVQRSAKNRASEKKFGATAASMPPLAQSVPGDEEESSVKSEDSGAYCRV